MTASFRESVLEDLASIGAPFRLSSQDLGQMRKDITSSRAIRLDGPAKALVDHHMDSITEEAIEDVILSMRLPWPRMWMELDRADGSTIGALFEQHGRQLTCEFYEQDRRPGLLRIYPPTLRMVADQEAESYKVVPTRIGRAMMEVMSASPQSVADMNQLINRNRGISVELLKRAAVLSVLLEARDILELEEGAPIPRAIRRRVEKNGEKLPADPVSRINLGELGRREFSMCFEDGEAEAAGQDGEKRRRAHWVRGHMFIARNRQLTYRRPHIRGTGAVLDNIMEVTAPEESGPEP